MPESPSFYEKLLEQSLGTPFTHGNQVRVLKNGAEIFPAMLQAINEAEERVEFLTFVYWKGQVAYDFANALTKKAKDGVDVFVILDSFGAAKMPEEISTIMEEHGVHVQWFRPLPQWKFWKIDNRTHRKVLICDGKIAFTGGVGIAEEWEGDARNKNEWRDTHFKITGPAVFGLQAAFMENWTETNEILQIDRQIIIHDQAKGKTDIQVIRTSASVRWSDIIMLYQTLIKMAKKNIRITTAYFNPNGVIVDLLKEASHRGVDIQIMVPGKYIDKDLARIAGEESFEPLLEAGIKLWYYQKTMLHSKVITVDDVISCVGSANFNHRSMLKDDEVNVVINDKDITEQLNNHFNEDLEFCEEVCEGRWKTRGFFKRTLEKITGLINPQI